MRESKDNKIFSRADAEEAAAKLRESASMARVFEPSQADVNDAKRAAWNKTINILAQRYGLKPTTFQPHKDISVYSVVYGDYLEGPVFVGAYRFYITVRFNIDLDEELLMEEKYRYVPHLMDPANFDGTYSELYDSIASALEDYASTGRIHRDAMDLNINVPSRMPDRTKMTSIRSWFKKWI
jgi:hypothetical protein